MSTVQRIASITKTSSGKSPNGFVSAMKPTATSSEATTATITRTASVAEA